MAKAKKKTGENRRGKIWFIGGPLDNRVEDWVWLPRLAIVREMASYKIGDCEESDYRLEQLCSRADHATEFFAYVHESVTHAELIERVYLPAAQPECRFDIGLGELNMQLTRAMSRANRPGRAAV